MYKISHIIQGAVKKIYVFSGHRKEEPLDTLFQKKPTDARFNGIFSPVELAAIQTQFIEVRFIPESFHLDDTIEIIKKKILLHLPDLNASFAELYLFTVQTEQFKAATLYQNLTQNEKLELTKERLIQFLLNIDEFDIETLPEKASYTFDDILALNLEEKPLTVYKPFGQKIVSLYPYTVNPYYAEFYDSFLEKFADELITTTNQNILLDHGEVLNKTLYLCLAEDVLNEQTLPALSTLNIYFPYLSESGVNSLDQLNARKQELLRETKAMLTPNFVKNIENINLFYTIYNERKEDLQFNDVGITSLIVVVHQEAAIHLPLANVFKLIHATQELPLIKMNLSKRQENIYRLYADKIASNGKKIPYLDKGVIFKWNKVMGRTTSVSVYIEHEVAETGSKKPIICEFNRDGSILINASFNTSLTIEEINVLLRKEVNPVIDVVKDYLAQDGYVLNTFVDLASTEIINIDFAMNISIEKEMKLNKMVGCLTSAFNVIADDLTKGIRLSFKRISNYNETESQEALILDMAQPHLGYSTQEIVKVLRTNFQLTETAALEKYAEVKRAQEMMEAGNKKLKKRNNPGFLTTIDKKPFTQVALINVTGITNLGYLGTLQIYLDSLIRMAQKPASTRVSTTAMTKLCSGKTMAKDEHVADIIAVIEQSNKQMTIVDEELVMIEGPVEEEEAEIDEADFLARFGYEDEEEPAEESGGAASESSEEEEEEEEGVVGAQEGVLGAQPLDITGLSLGNPTPFEKRIRKYDKNLFKTDIGQPNFSSYATDCPANRRRQPVVLTDEEKTRIDKEHPGSYSEAVKYGSEADKQFWYICPRYWDLKNNTSLNEAEVDKALVIPKNVPGKVVPPGKHIFEFNDHGIEHLDENKKYITHYPGFLKPQNNKCLPCCFKSWSEPTQASRRAQCTKDNTIVVPPGRKKKNAAEENNEYILAPDKFPITQENRFGYLPLAVQKFLHTDNKKCQISAMNTNIKPDHECLLRHSVEISQQQSFIACIADTCLEIHTKINNELVRPSIKRTKEILMESLTIDHFVTLQNGNLVKLFYPVKEESEDIPGDMANYAELFSKSNSKLYQMADKTNPVQINTLIKLARAYANFLAYLKDDTVEIDYEYLWDLICKPNPKLFPNGINLVILELARKDITESVELICPSNHHVTSFFDTKKSVILLLKIDNFYEPIYAYKNTADKITITRRFNMMYKDVLPNIKYVLGLIKETFNTKCAPLASMPKVYKFAKNIPLDKLTHELQLHNYQVEQQVMNYDNKIIGVVALNNKDNTKGYVPCYPSAPTLGSSSAVVYMSDTFADTYEHTKDFLEKLYTKSNKQIPCKPSMKVIDDDLIIGLLTITNQFVLLAEPTQDTFGADLKIMQNVNMTEVDASLSATSTAVDTDRVNYIKKIQLETKFYNVFRTTARSLLGQYEHNAIRREIEEKSNSSQLYLKKLQSIDTLLRQLMQPYIQFHTYAEEDLLKLDTITSCYANCKNKAYCTEVADGHCALLVPAINLIHQKPNDSFYYGKLADEIVRYSRIKSFIFNPKSVLSFTPLKYNLRENEIILLQTLLTKAYFENITPAKVNPYIKYNTFDTTQPILAQKYLNEVDYSAEKVEAAAENECAVRMKEHIAIKYWQAIFPPQSKERVYVSTPPVCSFNAILSIIHDHTQSTALTKNMVKEILLGEYLKLYPKYEKQILQILHAEGKKILTAQIQQNQLTLSDMIISEDYYATNLDLWLLAIYHDIPLVFLSDISLLENNEKFMVANASAEHKYYFLRVSATVSQLAPVYTLFHAEELAISLSALRDEPMQNAIRTTGSNSLIQYIENFSLTEVNKRKKTMRATAMPQATMPPATMPQATVVPQATMPQATMPQATMPQATMPQATMPPATMPPATMPQATVVPATVVPVSIPALVKKIRKKVIIK
jgi:hypothetical protein